MLFIQNDICPDLKLSFHQKLSNKGNAKCSIPTNPYISPWPWPLTLKSIGFILQSLATCVPYFIKMRSIVLSLICSQGYFYICPLWPWHFTIKINWIQFLIIGNTCAKFDQNILTCFISIMTHVQYLSIVSLTFDKKIKSILSPW